MLMSVQSRKAGWMIVVRRSPGAAFLTLLTALSLVVPAISDDLKDGVLAQTLSPGFEPPAGAWIRARQPLAGWPA